MAHILRKTDSFTGRLHARDRMQAMISAFLPLIKKLYNREVSQSPLLTLAMLIVTMFSIQTAIMFLFQSMFIGLPPWIENILDSISLITIMSPALYFFVLRPLSLHISELKKAGEDLRKCNERFCLAVNGTNDGIWDWDLETNAAYFSPRFMELLNYGQDELAHEWATFEFLLHPEDRGRVLDSMRQHLEDRVPYNVEYRMRTKDGEYRWFQARGKAVRNQSDKAFRMAGSITDITEQKKAGDALQHSEKEYRLLAENIPDVTWITDRSGRTSYISPKVEKVYGYTPEEICADGADIWFGRIHADDIGAVAEAFHRLFAEGRAFDIDYRIQRKDGQWIWLHDRSIATSERNGSKIAYGLFSDITDRKRTEISLKQARKELEATFDSISAPLFIHDARFRIVRANSAYLAVAGKADFNDIIGRPYYEVFPKMEGPFKMSRNTLKFLEIEEELKLPAMDRIFKVKSYPVKDADDNYLYSVLIFEDITTVAKAQERIKEEMEITAHLLMIAEAIAGTTDIDRLKEQVVHCVREIIGCDILFLHLWNSSDRVFSPSHEKGLPHNLVPLFMTKPLSEDEAEEVLLSGNHAADAFKAANYLDARDVILSSRPVLLNQHPAPGTLYSAFPWLAGLPPLAACIIPLKNREEILGILTGVFFKPLEINERLRKVMDGISHQVSTALEQARLYRESIDKTMELSRKVETIQVMHEIDKKILSTLDRQEIIETIVRMVAGLIPCDRVCIGLVNKGRTGIVYKAGFGMDSLKKGTFIPFKDTCNTEVIETGMPQFIADFGEIKDILPLEKLFFENGFRSQISMPLMIKGEVSGILNLGAKRRAAFTSEDLSTLSKISLQVGVALENSRLISDIEELFLGTIGTLSSAIDAKSPWTAGHSERVTKYVVHIGKEIGLSEKELKNLEIAGLLHDVGKIGTYEPILDKPGKLTYEEFELVKEHPVKGAELLENIKQLEEIIPVVRHHHECYNGTGYPDGLRGEDISLMARILAVADAVDAMGADRPYRKAMPMDIIVEELKRHSGGQFDPKVVEAFLRNFSQPEKYKIAGQLTDSGPYHI